MKKSQLNESAVLNYTLSDISGFTNHYIGKMRKTLNNIIDTNELMSQVSLRGIFIFKNHGLTLGEPICDDLKNSNLWTGTN